MTDIVQEPVNCSTAKEFLDAVSPIGPYFKDAPYNSRWLFRGQGKDWPLKPSLFRTDPDAAKKFKTLTSRNVIGDYGQLLLAERDFLLEFFRIADKRGFIIPDDSQELRSVLDIVRDDDFFVMNQYGKWLTSGSGKVLSLVAIAQHYGIPTRFLDWTLQPFIASFFAAEGGAKRYDDKNSVFDDVNNPIVVWAFYFPRFGVKKFISSGIFSVKGVTAPGASNPNLKAQQGVFTISSPDVSNESDGHLSFGDILEKIESGSFHRDVEGCKLRKFTLPVTETFELLKLFAKLDITPSSIYPGYHSIITDMQNQGQWSK